MDSRQRTFFESAPAPWQADDEAQQLVATVVFPNGPTQPFDYLVPERLARSVAAGRRVRVPFGRGDRVLVAYCVAVEYRHEGQHRLKPIQSLVDEHELLSPAMLQLTQWISGRYLCSWGQVLEAVVPGGVRTQAGTRSAVLLSVPQEVAQRLAELKLPPKQARILKHVAASPEPLAATEIEQAVGCTAGPIQALRNKGLLVAETRRVSARGAGTKDKPTESRLRLNPDQQAALDAILGALNSGTHQTVLLHGVTGSGKTEVYIQAIERVLAFGRQAIVLVPEISLTPQTRQRFRARFGDVALLHSHLSDAERHWHWRRISRGEVSVVVGARSAVFAPTPHLGLIVLDEEHETSFKQETAPRYHARDVAAYRARAAGVPLVLGSATPSLESWHRAARGEYRLISLSRRVQDRPMPEVETIDLRAEFHDRRRRGALSRKLQLAMEEALQAGGQVILLLNRRGYSTHIQCPSCGAVVRCPQCDIALTHHRQGEIALCHYCEYETPTPTHCPNCNFAGIRFGGLGTQRLEAEVQARFPNVKSLRMDTDAMQRPGSHEKALAAFRSGDVRILLGTQMIAKGLDFPNVTLVGVVNADIALHLPDFRAAERTFQLIVQVAGRTGRGERGGRVLVQTFSPDHPAIAAAVTHDYEAFAARELPLRDVLRYPPAADMVRLVIRGPMADDVRSWADAVRLRLEQALSEAGVDARLLGPAPAPLPKLRGLYRFHIQAQSAQGDGLREVFRTITEDLEAPGPIQWIVDVDPISML